MENVIPVEKTQDERIDELEATMVNNFDPVELPLTHRFTNGLYVREIFMPAGSLITSKIHKTQHQYFILKGSVSVWIDEGEEIFLEAPFIGVTEPGTRRVLYIWEDCVWATAHPNPENMDEIEIEEKIIEKRDNPLVPKELLQKFQLINSANQKKIKL